MLRESRVHDFCFNLFVLELIMLTSCLETFGVMKSFVY